MYAVIMKSNTPIGIRSTVIIPNGEDDPRVFSRIGEGRGRAFPWEEGIVDIKETEQVIGEPIAKQITPADYTALANGGKPTVLLAKLAQAMADAQGITNPDPATAVFDDIYTDAIEDPSSLGAYLERVIPNIVTPVITPTPQPVVQETPAVVMPAVTLTESETPMEYGTPICPASSDLAVLEIPDKEDYYERSWFGVTETTLYDYASAHSKAVLITGPAGTGKSSSARNYAAKRGLPFVTIECTQQIDQSVTQGRFVPTGVGNSLRWKYSQLATAVQQPSVILLNEMSRMSGKAAVLFLRLLQERELIVDVHNEVIKVHPQCIIIADQNVGSAYTGASKQDAALVDRYAVKMEFDYDSKIESNFIKSPALLRFASDIRDASKVTDDFSVPMSTRVLIEFQHKLQHLKNWDFALYDMLNNFPAEEGEREAIKMRLEAESDVIKADYGITN